MSFLHSFLFYFNFPLLPAFSFHIPFFIFNTSLSYVPIAGSKGFLFFLGDRVHASFFINFFAAFNHIINRCFATFYWYFCYSSPTD